MNERWCVQSKLDMRASEFIPADVLEKHGLDGNFNVAFKHSTDDKSIFFISDPSHAIKRKLSQHSSTASCVGMDVL